MHLYWNLQAPVLVYKFKFLTFERMKKVTIYLHPRLNSMGTNMGMEPWVQPNPIIFRMGMDWVFRCYAYSWVHVGLALSGSHLLGCGTKWV